MKETTIQFQASSVFSVRMTVNDGVPLARPALSVGRGGAWATVEWTRDGVVFGGRPGFPAWVPKSVQTLVLSLCHADVWRDEHAS